ncbi:hypothetical protein [Devosia sp.]|uniref:hypothetical protein n=1 Tax=Devosia sp. TaxID=1871048 RepID=UPI003BADB79A
MIFFGDEIMNRFAAQYVPSDKGLINAMPVIRRRLKLQGALRPALLAAGVGVGLLTTLIETFLRNRLHLNVPPHTGSVVAIVLFALVLLLGVAPWARSRMARRFDQLLPPVPTRLQADETGFQLTDDHSFSRYEWSYVHGAAATREGVAIMVGYGALFVPSSAFSDTSERDAFIELVNRRSAGPLA